MPLNGARLTPLELKLLGNIQANDRLAGVDESPQEIRFALINLHRMKLVDYKPDRPAQKFSITHAGLDSLREGKDVVLDSLMSAAPLPTELATETADERTARHAADEKRRAAPRTLRGSLLAALGTKP